MIIRFNRFLPMIHLNSAEIGFAVAAQRLTLPFLVAVEAGAVHFVSDVLLCSIPISQTNLQQ